LCAPTWQALLTGRNHHAAGMGGIPEVATSAPGYSSVRPNTAAPLAEMLKLNGYFTAQFGKCHEVPVWQTSPDLGLRRRGMGVHEVRRMSLRAGSCCTPASSGPAAVLARRGP
jgi:arylsulfatase A-like enzyme